ncbi:MAG: hypothetical protein ACI8P3_003327 [Saprospiraceae bacterium]|jgi:hypothetical protein
MLDIICYKNYCGKIIVIVFLLFIIIPIGKYQIIRIFLLYYRFLKNENLIVLKLLIYLCINHPST